MKTNVAAKTQYTQTHEGGQAVVQKPLEELTRAVSTCLLWENTFYEKGSDLATRIADLCRQVKPEEIAALAVRARTDLKLRHVPLYLVRQLARLGKGRLVGDTIAAVVQRPDEAAEFLALYWKGGREPLSAQVKKGLARAFLKWSPYQLAKWNRDHAVKLRDVLFLVHAKPKDEAQAATWKTLVEGTLAAPDTWEVALSAGADKQATWARLLTERKLGYMALLQNLRNMAEAKVDAALVESALVAGAKGSKALPFRFVAAAKAAPQYAQALSDAMLLAITDADRLLGTTYLVVDVSGSMDGKLSGKSTLDRLDAAGALAVLLREVCERAAVFTFSEQVVEVPNLRGLGLMTAMVQSQPHSGTHLAAALDALKAQRPVPDRLIVVTDEQAHDGLSASWATRGGYLVNVAPYKPGLDIRQGWTRINGWSERLVDWIRAEEAS